MLTQAIALTFATINIWNIPFILPCVSFNLPLWPVKKSGSLRKIYQCRRVHLSLLFPFSIIPFSLPVMFNPHIWNTVHYLSYSSYSFELSNSLKGIHQSWKFRNLLFYDLQVRVTNPACPSCTTFFFFIFILTIYWSPWQQSFTRPHNLR